MQVLESPMPRLDPVVLETAFEEQRPRWMAMLRARLGPVLSVRQVPEEVLQKAFVRVSTRRAAFERWAEQCAERAGGELPEADLAAMVCFWLNRIVHDCVAEEFRAPPGKGAGREGEVRLPDGSASQFALGLISPGTSPSGALAREELCERVWQTLALLKPEDQHVLWLRSIHGMPAETVAEVLGINHAAVRQRYGRAKLRFKDLWIERYGTEGFE
jgi:RNA polymerase sigma factor (sigma-70 family)